MKFKNLGIIGGGPNCVYALDVLLKKILKEKKDKLDLKISIYDKSGYFGCGIHSKVLGNNLLLNRVAGQISLGSYPFIQFPKKLKKYDYDFLDWCKKNRYSKIKYTDWPARAIFGQSLIDKFNDLLFLFRTLTKCKIILISKKILSVKKNKKTILLSSENNHKYFHDKILVITGTTFSNPSVDTFHYKTEKFYRNKKVNFYDQLIDLFLNKTFWKKKELMKNSLIYGMGVTAIDVISNLFQISKSKKIYCISRTGLFPFARPFNEKYKNTRKLEHSGIIFDKKLSIKIKKNLKIKKIINFEKSIYKILKIEFYLIYFQKFLNLKNYYQLTAIAKDCVKLKNLNDKMISHKFDLINDKLKNFSLLGEFNDSFYSNNWFANREIISGIECDKYNFFDFFENPLLFSNNQDFEKNYIKFVSWDINEAKKGNLQSQFKKASDGLWRDLRQNLTYIIDDNSLNPSSSKYFLRQVMSVHNRMADGPSLEKINELKNLIKKKFLIIMRNPDFLHVGKGSKVFFKDSKNNNQIHNIFFSILSIFEQNKNVLTKSMIDNKLVDLNKRDNFIQGLKLNKDLNPINSNGYQNKNIVFIGVPAEGIKFFHHTLSRPDKLQPNIIDIINWVKKLF